MVQAAQEHPTEWAALDAVEATRPELVAMKAEK